MDYYLSIRSVLEEFHEGFITFEEMKYKILSDVRELEELHADEVRELMEQLADMD